MSASVRVPPRIRFEVGQEMNSALRSIRNTSIVPSLHMRRYFAAVAPPKPPPMTMTRPMGFDGTAGPGAPPGGSEGAAGAVGGFRKKRPGKRFIGAAFRPLFVGDKTASG